jgi:hypothetical protein
MVTDGILASQLSGGGLRMSSASASAESVSRFEQAHARAVERLGNTEPSGISSFLDPLLKLNTDSTALAARANPAAGAEMRPSELMMLTMRSHEFLFHCELVANVANRSSDGVQQLFRQQS